MHCVKLLLPVCFIVTALSLAIGLMYQRLPPKTSPRSTPIARPNRTQKEASEDLDTQLPEPFKSRRQFLKKKCHTLFTKSARRIIWEKFPHNQMIVDSDGYVAYCAIEKAGSTFWKSVFAKLAGMMASDPQELPIEMLSKDDIHGIFLYKLKNLSRKRAMDFLKQARLFLFVRDPFVRLASTYMDKLFAPNYYYWGMGALILSKVRRGPTSATLKCGHDVEFGEFLKYFVLSQTKQSVATDPHWEPIWRLCQPCAIPYRYVGKVETFEKDARQILETFYPNASHLLRVTSRLDAIVRDVGQNIIAVLQHLEEYKKCLKLPDILRRLWELFIFKGYISSNQQFLLPKISNKEIQVNFETSLIHKFMNLTIQRIKQTLNIDLVDQRRYNMTRQMFANIPVSLCSDVQRHLHPDAVLFGYNSTLHFCSQPQINSKRVLTKR